MPEEYDFDNEAVRPRVDERSLRAEANFLKVDEIARIGREAVLATKRLKALADPKEESLPVINAAQAYLDAIRRETE